MCHTPLSANFSSSELKDSYSLRFEFSYFIEEEMKTGQCGFGFTLKLGNMHSTEWEHSSRSSSRSPSKDEQRWTVPVRQQRGLLCIKATPLPRPQMCLSVITHQKPSSSPLQLPLLSGFRSVIAVGEPLLREIYRHLLSRPCWPLAFKAQPNVNNNTFSLASS